MSDESPRETGNFTKSERECGYWVFLSIFVMSYFFVMKESLVWSTLEDLGIELARSLKSVYGAGCLALLFLVMCRNSNNGRRAVWYGTALAVFVAVVLVLDYFVFPNELVPIKVGGHVFVPPPANETWGVTSNATDQQLAREELQRVEGEIEDGFNKGRDAMPVLPAVILISVMGSAMYCFRVDSNKVLVATMIVIGIALIFTYKAMLVQYLDAAQVTNASETPVAKAAPAVPKPDVMHKPAPWAKGIDAFQASPSQGSSSSDLPALARLRGMGAQLDKLVTRTGAAETSTDAQTTLIM